MEAKTKLSSRLVTTDTGCMEFSGSRLPTGYGRMRANGGTVYTHRLAWALANGPIPDGMCVCHKCDNPPCCNPDHLFLGTPGDNARDRNAKGRNAPPSRAFLDGKPPVLRGELNPRAKLNRKLLEEMRAMRQAGARLRDIAGMAGVSDGTACRALLGRTWGE